MDPRQEDANRRMKTSELPYFSTTLEASEGSPDDMHYDEIDCTCISTPPDVRGTSSVSVKVTAHFVMSDARRILFIPFISLCAAIDSTSPTDVPFEYATPHAATLALEPRDERVDCYNIGTTMERDRLIWAIEFYCSSRMGMVFDAGHYDEQRYYYDDGKQLIRSREENCMILVVIGVWILGRMEVIGEPEECVRFYRLCIPFLIMYPYVPEVAKYVTGDKSQRLSGLCRIYFGQVATGREDRHLDFGR
ncbi:hypothetical protein DL96DRAFT_1781719 [Flagelloscypha sp. PMI_526]|nr:hypothetical protein DL96DRAFT_1781719 [Flagelloscypha sp. PMI_526]